MKYEDILYWRFRKVWQVQCIKKNLIYINYPKIPVTLLLNLLYLCIYIYQRVKNPLIYIPKKS